MRQLLDDYDPSTLDVDRYWINAELNEYINACIEEMCERTRCITDSLSTICLIPLVAGQRHYDLDDSVLDVVRVQPSWSLTPLSTQGISTAGADWLQAVGLPLEYLLDYSNGKLSITSAPATVSGEYLQLTVRRLPLKELSADTDIPEISRQYHRKLYDGVLSMAYLKQDAETYNPSKAKAHRDKWDTILSTTVRRESRLKPRVTVARQTEMC